MSESTKTKHSSLENFKIGLMVSLLVQPFEVIRTSSITSLKGSNANISGTLQVIKKIYQLEGFKGFFRGGSVAIIKSTLGAGIFFTGVENIHVLTKNLRESHFLPIGVLDFLNAAISRIGVTLVNNPITVIKTRFEVVGSTDNQGIIKAVSGVYKESGLSGFYKGIVPTLMRDIPWSGTQYSTYQFLVNTYKTYVGSPYNSPLLISFFGATASTIAVLATYPFDNLRVRMQIKDDQGGQKSMLQLSKKIFREEGITGFYLGYLPRLIKKGVSSAITWAIYESVKKDSVIH
jgi:Mitochondrial carrier protein.